jgi:hypothetical protein
MHTVSGPAALCCDGVPHSDSDTAAPQRPPAAARSSWIADPWIAAAAQRSSAAGSIAMHHRTDRSDRSEQQPACCCRAIATCTSAIFARLLSNWTRHTAVRGTMHHAQHDAQAGTHRDRDIGMALWRADAGFADCDPRKCMQSCSLAAQESFFRVGRARSESTT